jgi:hypothetical protein
LEVIAGIFVVGLVVLIGAVLVIREAGRLARNPPGALFDAEDAFEWVVERLPDDVAATLTADDVRRILDLQIEFFQQAQASTGNGDGPGPGDGVGVPVVVGSGDQIEYILERAAATGEAYLPEQVDAVVATQLAYLRNIGAVGPEARDDDA